MAKPISKRVTAIGLWVVVIIVLAARLWLGLAAREWIDLLASATFALWFLVFVGRALRVGHFGTTPHRRIDPVGYWLAIIFFTALGCLSLVDGMWELWTISAVS